VQATYFDPSPQILKGVIIARAAAPFEVFRTPAIDVIFAVDELSSASSECGKGGFTSRILEGKEGRR